jgi:hypothetical protein
MPIASYQGPPNHTAVLRTLVGETIKAVFLDSAGHVWMIVNSGHAVVWSGFDPVAPAFRVEQPDTVVHETGLRRQDLQVRIQELKDLAPGVDL